MIRSCKYLFQILLMSFEKHSEQNPTTNVLFVTNPTYEGLSIDLPKLVDAVRKINDKIIIFVDEAWGSLFSFSNKMPISAMESGADVCVQSTHKQGSGLQQSSMIHWKGNRIKSRFILDSYKSLSTTSPSFHLLASLDAARYMMETQGESIIDELINVSDSLRNELSKVENIKVVSPDFVSNKYQQVSKIDIT